ncbi:alcohol dehydrogenase catalytic domain-containing protein [Pseudomonas putida]|uniref:alcohol dehydrogenase catalytic domain-containing protein n=1 Tax=Pseudomonas putida TaxID=303 RepID=UPI001C8F9BE8|nr:alcohol dehydrogenase catalytic domain-containing protein [Pseudomonas putida]
MSDFFKESGMYTRYEFSEFSGSLRPVNYEMPVPKGSEVLLKVDYCGVCHSDVHVHDGYYGLGNGQRLSLEDRGIKLPLTLGHEVVGTVVAVGKDSGDISIGQQSLVYPWIGCGVCSVCLRGEENLCEKPASLGVFRPGGYSEYIVVPHRRYLIDIGNLNPANAALLACSGLTTGSSHLRV